MGRDLRPNFGDALLEQSEREPGRGLTAERRKERGRSATGPSGGATERPGPFPGWGQWLEWRSCKRDMRFSWPDSQPWSTNQESFLP